MSATIWDCVGSNAALTPLASRDLAPSFSAQGRQCISVINDGSSALRTVLSIPIEPWASSPYFPESGHGFQVVGATSATHAGLGLLNLYGSAEGAAHASDIGDTRGVGYKAIDGATSLAQSAFGFDYAAFRVANVAQMITTGDTAARWGDLSAKTGFWGNVTGAALYGFSAGSYFLLARESGKFKDKLDKFETEGEKVAYLQHRLHADKETLVKKEIKRLEKESPNLAGTEAIERLAERNIGAKAQAVAVDQQKKLLEKHIEFMKENGMCGKGFSLKKEELEAVVRERLGADALEEHGKEILVEKLKQKKVEKLTRRLGADAVKELQSPDKVDLSKIEVSHDKTRSNYKKRALLFALEAAAFVLLTIFTGGTSVLAITIFLAIAFTIELYMSYERMQELRKDTSTPGKYDEAWPVGYMIFNAVLTAAMYTIMELAGLAFAPLILPLILSGMWIGTNCYQIYSIRERREQYIDRLFEKDNLRPDEFIYILENGRPRHLEKLEKAFDKLNWHDQSGVEQFLKTPEDSETSEQKRKRYIKAAADYILESQKLCLQELAEGLEMRFGEERFRKASRW